MSLNTTLGKIEYNDDEEYRICIARIFCKVPSATHLEPTVPKELEQGPLEPTVPSELDDDFSFEPILMTFTRGPKMIPFSNGFTQLLRGLCCRKIRV